MTLLDELNDEQRAAVTAGDGPVMIVAGPGTGKTKTLAARAAWLLEHGAAPDEILALTFTRKAAGEMRVRADGLAGAASGGGRPEITTFHALALRLLDEDARAFVDGEERLGIVRGLKRPPALKALTVRELSLALSNAKNALMLDDEWAGVVGQYNTALRERNKRDFDDVLRGLYELAVREPARVRRRHVLVDEFQDTNELQYELTKLLAGAGGLFVIGDPRQSIYGFRGASGDVFERFEQDFPDARKVTLTLNYRSAPEIVRAGNAVFADAPVQLAAVRPTAGRVRLVETLDEYREAAWIVSEIEAGVGGIGMLGVGADDPEATGFRDYAVLYRTHRVAAALVRKLDESGIPFQIAGEGSPYERTEVRQIVDALTLLAGETADGDTAGAWLWAELRPLVGQVAVTELLQRVADQIGGYEEAARQRELGQLLSVATRFGSDAVAAAGYFAALRESEYYDPAAEAVTLATIHAAKGLEFEHVFVLGVEDGLLPHQRPGAAVDSGEEQRLFYVAVTRPKRWLDLVHARTRGGQSAVVSRFVAPLAPELVTDPGLARQERKRSAVRAKKAQGRLF